MIKTIAAGLLGSLVALGAHWTTGVVTRSAQSAGEKNARPALEVRKAGGLNVPVMRHGALQGYMVVQLGYSIEQGKDALAATTIEGILLDEAFRAIYSDSRLDPKSLQNYDIGALTTQLRDSVRNRIAIDGLKDILIQEFNFVPIGSFK